MTRHHLWFIMKKSTEDVLHIPQTCNTRRTKAQNINFLFSSYSRLFAQSIEARCKVENEDVVEVAPTGDAPTTSEWSTILLPTKVRLLLEVWRYARVTYILFIPFTIR